MTNETIRTGRFANWAGNLWGALREHFGSVGRRRRGEPIRDRASLRYFLQTRASYVAQISLYGYLRTRAGMLYPQLFDDDEYVRMINIAKWHIWLACLSDLSVYTGGLMLQNSPASTSEIGALMDQLVATILDETGIPAEAGSEFSAHAERVQMRLKACDWERVTDDATPFSESPPALIRWAPVVDSFKEVDEAIVKNSIRFRWQEIRRELRRSLDSAAVRGSAP